MKEERAATHLVGAEGLSPKGGMHSRAIYVVFIMIQQILHRSCPGEQDACGDLL